MPPAKSVADESSKVTVSVLGLGLMGSALARVLIENGWKTTVWNRTAEKALPLVAIGGVHATTIDECIRASRLVIICLLDQRAVTEILTSCNASSGSGRILVDFTSGLPSATYQNQELARDKSFSAYMRGAIETIPQFVGLPESVFYYSGDETEFKSIEAALKILGTPIYLGTDVSLASLQESILGTCFYVFSMGFIQSMALLKSSKLYGAGGAESFTSESVVPFLTDQLPSLFLDLAKQIDAKDYNTKGTGVRLDTLAQSLRGLINTSTEQGISSSVFGPMLRIIEERLAQGGHAEEMSGLVEVIAHKNLSQ